MRSPRLKLVLFFVRAKNRTDEYGQQTLNWIVRSATEVETNIVSVERIQEYIELKPEAATEIKATEPAASWPAEGSLSYQGVSARYRANLDLVLRDVSFELKGGEKVGVCGRTGAGKSSLTMVLYRVVEPESGTILIDGVDVSTIGLNRLRSSLSIIPQDSQCFEGVSSLSSHSPVADAIAAS